MAVHGRAFDFGSWGVQRNRKHIGGFVVFIFDFIGDFFFVDQFDFIDIDIFIDIGVEFIGDGRRRGFGRRRPLIGLLRKGLRSGRGLLSDGIAELPRE